MCAGIICVCMLRFVFVAVSVLKLHKEPAVGVKAQPLVLSGFDGEINRKSCEIKSVN